MRRRRRTRGRLKGLVVLAAIAGLVWLFVATFRAGPPATIGLESRLPAIGKRTPIDVVVEEPKRGLSAVRVELVQGEHVQMLAAESHEPRKPWEFWGPRTAKTELTVEVGKETVQGLKEGRATIRVVADRAAAWLRTPQPATEELTLDVILRPPTLQVLSSSTYVAQGGCEAVVYQVGESSVRDGVQAGDWWFPGFPLPGDATKRFAIFSAPYDLEDRNAIRLVAYDVVENEASATFVDRFTPQPVKTDTIRVSERFMERVVPAIMNQTPELEDRGSLLENYLMINGELRKKNAETLIELARSSVPDFLWNDEFLQMRNAQVMSTFADRRTYSFEGRVVDRQDHLGFDLASVRRAEIQAGNDGIVVLARYFGIYGNTVVIDHGFGLMSLYGHLSTITVQEGQEVERGDVVGNSGATGLAGGDHLHFTLLLQGLPVNPREWWDARWIEHRIGLKLGPALPFAS